MRTRHTPTPKDPLCRPWRAHEAARRRRQVDHPYRVAVSNALEQRCEVFRAEKAERIRVKEEEANP